MKNCAILLLVIVLSPPLYSREEPKNLTILSLVPQYMAVNGIRLDLDHQLNPRHFLQFCPQFYFRENRDGSYSDFNRRYNDLLGGGLFIYHKTFVSENIRDNGLYLSYGLCYNYYYLQYMQRINHEDMRVTGNINKAGGDLLIGFQYLYLSQLSIDIYFGYGFRYSIMHTDEGEPNTFNNTFWDYNYSGNIFQLGLRIGIVL